MPPAARGHQTLSDVHLRTLRRVLTLPEGRRAVRRRPPRRGRLPHRRGARPPREHVVLHRRALQPGARASRASRSCRRRRARSTATTTARRSAPEPATPLFSLDQSPFEQAVAADHVNVEDTARRVSRSEVDGAIEAIAAAERILIAGTDQMAFFASYLRHLLMLLDVRAEIAASPVPGGADAGSAGSTSARW